MRRSAVVLDATPKKGRLDGCRYTTGQIGAALTATGGLVHLAARRLGCDASTVFRRVNVSPELRRILDTTREELEDLAEAGLRRAVRKGEPWAVCFTLKTIGRTRGYTERVEHTGADAGPIQFTFAIEHPKMELSKLSDEDLDDLRTIVQ